jgi:hypothetical protein
MNINTPFNKTKRVDEALLLMRGEAALIDKELPTFARTLVLPSSEPSSASGIEILYHEDGNKKLFRNAGNYYSAETASYSRRLES